MDCKPGQCGILQLSAMESKSCQCEFILNRIWQVVTLCMSTSRSWWPVLLRRSEPEIINNFFLQMSINILIILININRWHFHTLKTHDTRFLQDISKIFLLKIKVLEIFCDFTKSLQSHNQWLKKKDRTLVVGCSGRNQVRDVLFEFHLKLWNTDSVGIPVRSLL